MSRGPGLLMRLIVELLTGAEDSTMTRAKIEDELLPLGFRSDNILRAIRSLERFHIVRMQEGRFAETSKIRMFRPVENLLSDEEVMAIIGSLG